MLSKKLLYAFLCVGLINSLAGMSSDRQVALTSHLLADEQSIEQMEEERPVVLQQPVAPVRWCLGLWHGCQSCGRGVSRAWWRLSEPARNALETALLATATFGINTEAWWGGNNEFTQLASIATGTATAFGPGDQWPLWKVVLACAIEIPVDVALNYYRVLGFQLPDTGYLWLYMVCLGSASVANEYYRRAQLRVLYDTISRWPVPEQQAFLRLCSEYFNLAKDHSNTMPPLTMLWQTYFPDFERLSARDQENRLSITQRMLRLSSATYVKQLLPALERRIAQAKEHAA